METLGFWALNGHTTNVDTGPLMLWNFYWISELQRARARPKCGGTNLQKEAPKDSTEKKDEALKILKMRFVKGEITKEEYLEMKKLIT